MTWVSHPDDFTSSHHRLNSTAWVELRWELCGGHQLEGKGKSTGSDSRCLRDPHTTQLSRQPRVKTTCEGFIGVVKSFVYKTNIITALFRPRSESSHSGIIFHCRAKVAAVRLALVIWLSRCLTYARSVSFRNLALRKRLKDQGTTLRHVCRVTVLLTVGAPARCFHSTLANVSQVS